MVNLSNKILDVFYNREHLDSALQLAASMALRDLHDVMLQIPTNVAKGSEYDTLDSTHMAMELLCKEFIKTLEIKMNKNLQESMRQLGEIARERDGI